MVKTALCWKLDLKWGNFHLSAQNYVYCKYVFFFFCINESAYDYDAYYSYTIGYGVDDYSSHYLLVDYDYETSSK